MGIAITDKIIEEIVLKNFRQRPDRRYMEFHEFRDSLVRKRRVFVVFRFSSGVSPAICAKSFCTHLSPFARTSKRLVRYRGSPEPK